MKSSDMRAKARAIFGSAIAEPMPKQPNGAKALQQRANARPIPTYKVGGAVKSTPPGPTAAEREEARRQNERLKKAKVTPKEGKVIDSANRSEGSMYKKGGSVMKKAAGGSTSPFGKAFADARKRGEKTFNFGGKSYTTETREDVQKRAMAASAEREKRTEGNRAAMRQKTAAGTEERGKSSFQRSTDKFYKKYPEAMKKGGKPKDGLAVMIAIGKPMKGMKKPVKRAVGGKIAKKAYGGKAADRGPTTQGQSNAAMLRMQGVAAKVAPKGATSEEMSAMVKKMSADQGRKAVGVTAYDDRPAARGSAKQALNEFKNRTEVIAGRPMPETGVSAPRPEPRPVPVSAPPEPRPEPRPETGVGASRPVPATSTRVDPNRPQTLTLKNVPQQLTLSNVPGSPPRPIKKGGAVMKPVKRAVGGAGKTRKGMC